MIQTFDSLHLRGYRGIREIDLTELGQVNILVGDNNSGKTSILEAISIFCNPLDPFQWLEVSKRRLYLGRSLFSTRPNLEAIKWIFSQENNFSDEQLYQKEIYIEASGNTPISKLTAKLSEIYGSGTETTNSEAPNEEISEGEDESIDEFVRAGIELDIFVNYSSGQLGLLTEDKETFQFWENERFVQRKRNQPFVESATIFPSYTSSEPIVERLSRIILKREHTKDEVLEIIREFDDKILNLIIAARNTIYIEHQDIGFAPLYVFGDGLKRTLVIALTLLSAEKGVLLVDEIETSIHISAISSIFSWLVKACQKREIQLFLTTHSLEAIDAILQTDIETDKLVAFRLNRGKKSPQRFSGDLLHRLRLERGLDVR